MKSFLLFCALAASACGPTKRVAERPADKGIADVPKAPPSGPLPDVEFPDDATLQNDEVEAFSLSDAQRTDQRNPVEADNTVYLSMADIVNRQGDTARAKEGADLALNTLSNQVAIRKSRVVAGTKDSILAVDLRDFFGSRASEIWQKIENTQVIPIQSITARAKLLQFITGKRIPIIPLGVFLETAFLAQNYYDITEVPLNENDFWLKFGVDRQGQFDERDPSISLSAFQESLIAPGHNRTVRRIEGNLPCWNTYDIDSNQLVAQSNYFSFPFPIEARSGKQFIFNAGEIICIKPNGTMAFALYNAAGVRADFAPVTVVVNTRTAPLGLGAEIGVRDCLGCHTKFVLPFKDQQRSNIAKNIFAAADKRLGELFFRPQAEVEATWSEDNDAYDEALAKIGASTQINDPMNAITDDLRDGADLAEIAARLYLSEDQLIEKLNGSAAASSEFGQLQEGGRIGFFQLQQGIAVLVEDLNLFRDLND